MEALRVIAEWRTPLLDSIMLVLTEFGAESVAIVVVCILFWCINKKAAYALGFAYFFSGLTVNSLKIGLRVDRPWIIDPDFIAVEAALEGASGYSFPSGHTQSAAAMFGTLGLTVRKGWLKALILLLVPVVGFSRMYLGVHTPADVFVGFAIGAAFAVLFAVFYCKDMLSDRFITVCGAILSACGIAALIYALCLYSGGTIEYKYASDISKMVGASIGLAVGCPLERAFVRFSTKTAHLWQQFVKLAVGIAVTLGIKSGLKLVFALIIPDAPLFDALRYMLVILWALLLWPMIFSRLFKAPEEAAQN